MKDVEIISLDGLYKFRLYHHDQFAKEVVCKPSIWYPLNFRKVDKELDRIRSWVRRAHHEFKEETYSANELQSFN